MKSQHGVEVAGLIAIVLVLSTVYWVFKIPLLAGFISSLVISWGWLILCEKKGWN